MCLFRVMLGLEQNRNELVNNMVNRNNNDDGDDNNVF